MICWFFFCFCFGDPTKGQGRQEGRPNKWFKDQIELFGTFQCVFLLILQWLMAVSADSKLINNRFVILYQISCVYKCPGSENNMKNWKIKLPMNVIDQYQNILMFCLEDGHFIIHNINFGKFSNIFFKDWSIGYKFIEFSLYLGKIVKSGNTAPKSWRKVN